MLFQGQIPILDILPPSRRHDSWTYGIELRQGGTDQNRLSNHRLELKPLLVSRIHSFTGERTR